MQISLPVPFTVFWASLNRIPNHVNFILTVATFRSTNLLNPEIVSYSLQSLLKEEVEIPFIYNGKVQTIEHSNNKV